MQRPRYRLAGSLRFVLPALLVVLSVAGFVVATTSIQRDRRAQESRRVQVERVRTQGILGTARAYVAGLSNVLGGEPERSQRRFAQLQAGTASGLGLTDAFWVERVPASRRAAYARRLGAPITRVATGGDRRPAPPAASYLPVTFRTTAGTAGIPRGADVSDLPVLADAIGDVASVFAVTATPKVALGNRAGFFALKRARFGSGAGSTGFLVVFIPQGWLTLSLEGDPREFAIAVEGRRLEGTLDRAPAAVASFRALGRGWTVGVARGRVPASQELLPWLALGWPWAFALIAALAARAVTRRRRAEREAARIFDLAFDLLCVADRAGYFTRVNPAFGRTLGTAATSCCRVRSSTSSTPTTGIRRVRRSRGLPTGRTSGASRTATFAATAPRAGSSGARGPRKAWSTRRRVT